MVATVTLRRGDAQIDASRLRALIGGHHVDRVILAPVTTDARDTLDLVRVAKRAGVRVSLLPRLFEVVGSSVEFDHIEGLTMLGVRRFGLTRSSYALKRAFDLAGATLLLLLTAPLMAVVAIRRAILEQVADGHEVAERLRHLLALHLQEAVMQPDIGHHGRPEAAARLGDLVLVVREDEVEPAGMDVEHLAEMGPRHRRALDVPARPPGSAMPQGEGQDGSPGFAGFQSTKSSGERL